MEGRHESYDELILWFEHDLFDQLNLIQLLTWIRDLSGTPEGHAIRRDVTLTDTGRSVLSGRQDRVGTCGIDRPSTYWIKSAGAGTSLKCSVPCPSSSRETLAADGQRRAITSGSSHALRGSNVTATTRYLDIGSDSNS